MGFPEKSHHKLTAPGIGVTPDQLEYLYQIYSENVLNGKINYHKDAFEKKTYNFLKEKSQLPGPKIIAFLQSLKDWAIQYKSEIWRNPILRKNKDQELKDKISAPLRFLTKEVSTTVKDISEPISKPLMYAAVIVAGVSGLYFANKMGIFKKVARAGKK